MIIFQPANSEQLTKGESLATVSADVEAPTVGTMVSLGKDREWMVTHVETYYQDLKPLYLATVAKHEQASGDWTAVWMRERSPHLSFYVQVSPDGEKLGCGYQMDGGHPIGRLYNCTPTDHPTRLQEVDRPWVTDLVDTYRPSEHGLYSAVHICHCQPVSLPELAVA